MIGEGEEENEAEEDNSGGVAPIPTPAKLSHRPDPRGTPSFPSDSDLVLITEISEFASSVAPFVCKSLTWHLIDTYS